MGQTSSFPRRFHFPKFRRTRNPNPPSPWARWAPNQTTPMRIVRVYLARFGLPRELVDLIIAAADYYPAIRYQVWGSAPLVASPRARDDSDGMHLAARSVFGCGFHPRPARGETVRVRKVAFVATIRSQGPTDGLPAGAPPGAHAWLDVVLVRPAAQDAVRVLRTGPFMGGYSSEFCTPLDKLVDRATVPPGQTRLETFVRNDSDGSDGVTWLVCRDTDPDWENGSTYGVVWRPGEHTGLASAERGGYGTGEGFLEALQPGDMIELWVGTKYPGSMICLKGLGLEVLYDVC